MQFVAVVVAAIANFAFGAFWYMTLAKPWMAASGVPVGPDGRPAGGMKPAPVIVSAITSILVAGLMRHIFALSGIDTLGEGLVSGLGVGAFFIVPWMAMNNAYGMRPAMLTVIDGGYAILGCGIIGTVLVLFL